MINKTIIAGLVALAFVAGSIMTGNIAYAASNTQGQPFQALDKRITALEENSAQSDSFFDVFTDLGFTVDSFFDIFTELQLAIGDPDFDLLRNGNPDFDTEVDARKQGDADTLTLANQYADSRVTNPDWADLSGIPADIEDGDQVGLQQTDSFFDVFVEVDLPSCSDGQVPKRDSLASTGWICASDEIGSGGGSTGRLVVREVRDTTPGILRPLGDSFAACDTGSGEIPIGGGYELTSANAHAIREQIAFTSEGHGWLVTGVDNSAISELISIAYCAKILP